MGDEHHEEAGCKNEFATINQDINDHNYRAVLSAAPLGRQTRAVESHMQPVFKKTVADVKGGGQRWGLEWAKYLCTARGYEDSGEEKPLCTKFHSLTFSENATSKRPPSQFVKGSQDRRPLPSQTMRCSQIFEPGGQRDRQRFWLD